MKTQEGIAMKKYNIEVRNHRNEASGGYSLGRETIRRDNFRESCRDFSG